ncbi:MAG: sodium:calcium antiporter, partial [Desulfobacteraceae bacterium]|nr:sodium:calcium antiporter [Desulfobacteraceae bacterium]
MLFSILFLIVGFILLVVGAELLVRGASRIALAFGISPLVVGLT